jgi:hypothetical protein
LQAQAEEALHGLAGEITLDVPAQLLHIRLLNAVSHLAAIIASLKTAGFLPGQVSLRANSLEDVFISLTGRKLRE